MNKKELKNGTENSLFVLLGEEQPKAPWLWEKMPRHGQEEEKFYATINVRVKSEEELNELAKVLGVNLTKKTKALRWPPRDKFRNRDLRWVEDTTGTADLTNIE